MSISIALAAPADAGSTSYDAPALPHGEENAATGDYVAGNEEVFARPFNEALVHQAVVACLAHAKRGTKAQKSRASARGGGRKPWRQKGGGRARAGSIRSPLWRGGGRTFAARPQRRVVKLNRKMYRGALRCILAELVRQDRLLAVPSTLLCLPVPKTQELAKRLDPLLAEERRDVLAVTHKIDRNLRLAAHNLRGVEVCDIDTVNPVSLIAHRRVLMTVDALKAMEERLK